MITIEMVMLAALGFLTAALLALFIAPLYRRRVARLTTEMLKRSMPLTEAEIRADKDRLRAEAAIRIHKLETKVEEAAEASARQMVELNRRDATISELEGEVARQGTALEEHENARRVLEQTIMDRLPKVEHRLAEARKLLFQRDREIVSLTQSSEKQSRALEEATQINTQQTDEVHRLKAALNTRASRNREGFGDAALRWRGGAAHRDRGAARQDARSDGAHRPAAVAGGARRSGRRRRQTPRLSTARAMPCVPPRSSARARSAAEGAPPLKAVDRAAEAPDPQTQAEIRRLKSVNQDQAAELSRLKAALTTYEAADKRRSRRQGKQDRHESASFRADGAVGRAVRHHPGAARRACRRQREAGAAGGLLHGRDAPPGLGHDAGFGAGAPLGRAGRRGRQASAGRAHQRSARRPPRAPGRRGGAGRRGRAGAAEPRRVSGFLKALDARLRPRRGSSTLRQRAPAAGEAAAGTEVKRTRKARLLDRITGLDKNSA